MFQSQVVKGLVFLLKGVVTVPWESQTLCVSADQIMITISLTNDIRVQQEQHGPQEQYALSNIMDSLAGLLLFFSRMVSKSTFKATIFNTPDYRDVCFDPPPTLRSAYRSIKPSGNPDGFSLSPQETIWLHYEDYEGQEHRLVKKDTKCVVSLYFLARKLLHINTNILRLTLIRSLALLQCMLATK